MRLITNAMLCSAARVALLEGRLGAANCAIVCWRDNGLVCAIGANLTQHETNILLGMGIEGPDRLTLAHSAMADIAFEDIAFAQQLAFAHDHWANEAACDRGAGKRAKAARAAFLALLDLHDPVKALERASQPLTSRAVAEA